MLKKTIFLTFLLSTAAFSLDQHGDATLVVTPSHPEVWGYQGATLTVNHGLKYAVSNHVIIPVAINDAISVDVYAMNAHPKLADSCKNIRVIEKGTHTLQFELQPDWLVHCRYS